MEGSIKENVSHIGQNIGQNIQRKSEGFVGRLDALPRAIRRASESLREDHEERLASYVDRFADKAENYFRGIRDKASSVDFVERAESAFKTNPVIAVAILSVGGFLLFRYARPYLSSQYSGSTGQTYGSQEVSSEGRAA